MHDHARLVNVAPRLGAEFDRPEPTTEPSNRVVDVQKWESSGL